MSTVEGILGKLPGKCPNLCGDGLIPVCVAYSKAQKHQGSPELAEHLQGLNLKERPRDVPLARIQRLFSFRALGSGNFPQAEKNSFQEHLALIPSGMVSAFGWVSCPLTQLVELSK